ncbi:MAG: hypothetical protein RL204_526 [Bacteroidota bacterium]|jgi:hypothetical protein
MRILIAISILFLLHSCNGTKSSVHQNSTRINLDSTIETSIKIGYNTANTFTYQEARKEELFSTIEKIKPDLLRFPGGTIANFYHPGNNNYGFKGTDTTQIVGNVSNHLKKLMSEDRGATENYLERCIELCQQTKSSVLLVANVLNGSIEELESMISTLQENKIEIEGIELGNELYLKAYKKRIPNVEAYIDLCKPFAEYLKNAHPQIPISVCIESRGDDSIASDDSWNAILARESFFDAVAFHYYFRCGACDQENENEKSICFIENVQKEYSEQFVKTVDNLKNLFPNKPLWLTEFNLFEPGKNIGGTNAQAIILLEFTLRMYHSNKIEKIILHNIAGIDKPFSGITITDDSITKNAWFNLYESILPKIEGYTPLYNEHANKAGYSTYYYYNSKEKSVCRIIVNTANKPIENIAPRFYYQGKEQSSNMIRSTEVNISDSLEKKSFSSIKSITETSSTSYTVLMSIYSLN